MSITETQFLSDFARAINLEEGDAKNMTPATALASLASWDSIAIISLIIFFDLEYSKKVTADQIKKCRTIADLYAKIL